MGRVILQSKASIISKRAASPTDYFADKAARDAAKVSAQQTQKRRGPPVYTLRPAHREDHNFIYDSWSSSYRHGAASDKIPADVYKIEQRARITRILRVSKLTLLTSPEAPHIIHGWICFTPPESPTKLPTLHYILMHPNLQMQGLSSQLLSELQNCKSDPQSPCWCTHWTLPMRKLIPRWNLIYNPFILETLK